MCDPLLLYSINRRTLTLPHLINTFSFSQSETGSLGDLHCPLPAAIEMLCAAGVMKNCCDRTDEMNSMRNIIKYWVDERTLFTYPPSK